jgi:hypothetical protein
MTEPFDLDKHLAEQARARALGMDYSEIRRILLSVGGDGDDGISEGRAVELVREMALRAVDRAVAEERAAVVAWLRAEPETVRECDGHRHKDGTKCCVISPMTLDELAAAIERGEHRRGEGE